jgi:hypothetical protein
VRAFLICVVACGSPPAPVAPPLAVHAPTPSIDAAACATLDASLTQHAIDLDNDGVDDVAATSAGCGLRCDFALYLRRGGCLIAIGTIHNLMGAPYCTTTSPGAPCELSGMRLMIHGDAQEYLFVPGSNGYGEGTPGSHYVPPRKR